MFIKVYKRATVASVVVFMLTALSCTGVAVKKGPSGNLDATVRDYYDLLAKGDIAGAWNFERLSINKDKSLREVGQHNYLNSQVSRAVKKYEIVEIGEEGTGEKGFTPVTMRVTKDYPSNITFKFPKGDWVSEYIDNWDKIDGKWYHVIKGMTDEW